MGDQGYLTVQASETGDSKLLFRCVHSLAMDVNFKCKTCHREFDCDVGQIELSDESEYPVFESPIVCPTCGQREMDEVELTEQGQSQMTEATWDL